MDEDRGYRNAIDNLAWQLDFLAAKSLADGITVEVFESDAIMEYDYYKVELNKLHDIAIIVSTTYAVPLEQIEQDILVKLILE